MLTLLKLPKLSLMLLFFTYGCLGWKISQINSPWYIWIAIAVIALFVNSVLTNPSSRIVNFLNTFFKSGWRAFSGVILSSLFLFAILAWFRSFLFGLLIFCATTLVRVDFQMAGFKSKHFFWFTFILSLIGLVTGILIHMLVTDKLSLIIGNG
ncbi:MAG: hypothetical protein QNJ49_03040 [Mastigocoleus sp. MO_167.B18]|uniref:hypothetical protein n=1 Tax=Mastigocoleus sp. MO_188.B34 TaxID=3036635 RepID=UPI00262C5474|nr:hypothetical protein [Mastigocoleus sp. MO_188.B34]MDJ0695396.1 hypothetical protein [Mastigocoleus sp. MO_188.B34]MDJ0772392.1 hypothetical protein [Mastigocoleus sp. MO_167.B18]